MSQTVGLTQGEWFTNRIKWKEAKVAWKILLSALKEDKLPSDVFGLEIVVLDETNLVILKVLVKDWNEGTKEIGNSLWQLGIRTNVQVQ